MMNILPSLGLLVKNTNDGETYDFFSINHYLYDINI